MPWATARATMSLTAGAPRAGTRYLNPSSFSILDPSTARWLAKSSSLWMNGDRGEWRMPAALRAASHGAMWLSFASATASSMRTLAMLDTTLPWKPVSIENTSLSTAAMAAWSVASGLDRLYTGAPSPAAGVALAAMCQRPRHTSNACTVSSLRPPSHRNFMGSVPPTYASAHTHRGIRPRSSPGPYTVLGRAITSGRSATARTASSAASAASATLVHGAMGPDSFAGVLLAL
mmetsp:Transcript_11801/g.46058  ORF Transcript_11801/g.46058 Transcript_11801/m.46058 type:complete len:233 (+) Transcript_11801:302-1000(+)